MVPPIYKMPHSPAFIQHRRRITTKQEIYIYSHTATISVTPHIPSWWNFWPLVGPHLGVSPGDTCQAYMYHDWYQNDSRKDPVIRPAWLSLAQNVHCTDTMFHSIRGMSHWNEITKIQNFIHWCSHSKTISLKLFKSNSWRSVSNCLNQTHMMISR